MSKLIFKTEKFGATKIVIGLIALIIFIGMAYMLSDMDANRQISRGEELNMQQIIFILGIVCSVVIFLFVMIILTNYIEVYSDKVEGFGNINSAWGSMQKFNIPKNQISYVQFIGGKVVIGTKNGLKYFCWVGNSAQSVISAVQTLISDNGE